MTHAQSSELPTPDRSCGIWFTPRHALGSWRLANFCAYPYWFQVGAESPQFWTKPFNKINTISPIEYFDGKSTFYWFCEIFFFSTMAPLLPSSSSPGGAWTVLPGSAKATEGAERRQWHWRRLWPPLKHLKTGWFKGTSTGNHGRRPSTFGAFQDSWCFP